MGRVRVARPKARVLVVSPPSLFEEGIEELLRQEQGLEIVGRETDPREAVRLIKKSHPDVILVAHGEASAGYAPELMGLVREGFRLRVVDVHLDTNTVLFARTVANSSRYGRPGTWWTRCDASATA